MATTVRDVLSADLVLVGVNLINSPGELDLFRQSIDEEVQPGLGLAADLASGLTAPGRTFTLPRDRIVLNVSPGRSSIAKEYPSTGDRQEDLARLAQVAACAINSSNLEGQAPLAFGYNMSLVFDPGLQDPAIVFLGQRLFGNQFPNEEGWELVGGTGKLIFSDGDHQWTITLQPRPDDDFTSKRVFAALNLHIAEARMPQQDEILGSLIYVWDQAERFMARLDGSAS